MSWITENAMKRVFGVYKRSKERKVPIWENDIDALKTLNSKILKIHKFRLPESNDERIIIEIQKLKEISSRYPRKTGIPAKKPL